MSGITTIRVLHHLHDYFLNLNATPLSFNLFLQSHYLSIDYLERFVINDLMKGFIHLVIKLRHYQRIQFRFDFTLKEENYLAIQIH